MPKLVGPDDLSATPSARTGRQIARYDTSAVSEGARQLGQSMSVAGATLQARQDEIQKYDAVRFCHAP